MMKTSTIGCLVLALFTTIAAAAQTVGGTVFSLLPPSGVGSGQYANGNGDAANFSTVDNEIDSWWGVGIKSQCSGCNGNNGLAYNGYGIVFDARAASIYTQGRIGIGTTSPSSKLTVSGGNLTGANQIFNNIELQLAGYNGTYYGTGTGILFDSAANGGLSNAPIGEVTGYLVDGGSNGSDYAGNLGFAAKGQGTPAPIERMTIQGSTGNVGIGTTSPAYNLDVNGAIHATGAVIASGGVTFPDGSVQTQAFSSVLCGGDYAESVDVTGNRTAYEPGDVLVIDPEAPGKFLKASEAYSTLVAGVYSTKPGTVGRRQTTPKNPDELPMAVVGIVPTKVTAEGGPIRVGDLLVASSTLGRAMKGSDRSRLTGAVIGKALGSLESGTGTIEVLVTLQ